MSSTTNASLHLSIITPEKTLFSAEAQMVVVPGAEGDFGVLPGHMNFVSLIRPGVITIDLPGGQKRYLAVVSGLAEVNESGCSILAEAAQELENTSPAETQQRLSDARRELDEAVTDDQKTAAAQRVALAEAATQIAA